MQATTSTGHTLDAGTAAFYRRVLDTLNASGIPFLVGGAYAVNHYTGINRYTRDLDIFIRRDEFEQISGALLQAGFETELTYPHWLGKIRADGIFIDLIFSSGNGIAKVDDTWFEHADDAVVASIATKICPVEEIIWSKAFVMERERYDGADIAHLLLARGSRLDWQRLLLRFEPYWRVLLCHLILFGFAYPADRDTVPAWIMDDLLARLRQEIHAPPPQGSVCMGTLLSREQYLCDIRQQGLQDGRIAPLGNMTAQDIAHWTAAIPDDHESD